METNNWMVDSIHRQQSIIIEGMIEKTITLLGIKSTRLQCKMKAKLSIRIYENLQSSSSSTTYSKIVDPEELDSISVKGALEHYFKTDILPNTAKHFGKCKMFGQASEFPYTSVLFTPVVFYVPCQCADDRP